MQCTYTLYTNEFSYLVCRYTIKIVFYTFYDVKDQLIIKEQISSIQRDIKFCRYSWLREIGRLHTFESKTIVQNCETT